MVGDELSSGLPVADGCHIFLSAQSRYAFVSPRGSRAFEMPVRPRHGRKTYEVLLGRLVGRSAAPLTRSIAADLARPAKPRLPRGLHLTSIGKVLHSMTDRALRCSEAQRRLPAITPPPCSNAIGQFGSTSDSISTFRATVARQGWRQSLPAVGEPRHRAQPSSMFVAHDPRSRRAKRLRLHRRAH